MTSGGWALTALAALSVAATAPTVPTAVSALSGQSLPEALIALANLLLLTTASWVVVVAALTALRTPERVLRLITPRLLRRALFAGAAGALALAPAHAEQAADLEPPTRHDLTGLRLPDRPVVDVDVRTDGRVAHVVVRPGDTLWVIAERSLPDGASDAEIAAACRAWHRANRAVVGDDPDLLFPAQRLVPPPGKDPT